ncbi:DUF72 domain-containing protein [Bdellovibrio sp. HCB2-146]|uniref:DUF72 domain-containing protein n=1 Tax=Bdellovibrio sp. HCB2-146 TaxID=3394362 RepID=UPI0039BC9784
MEFGKLPSVDKVDWTLPPEDSQSLSYLQSLPKMERAQFYIGTPAWGHKEWVGKIYPPKTKAADYLAYYSQNFNTIELNTSHYRIPTSEQAEKWTSQVTDEFLFCPKLFQGISHSETGMLDKSLLKEWFRFLESLKDHRGPCFMQFPPHFDYSRKAVLFNFLQEWPAEFELSLEFRHPTWFQDRQILPALANYLRGKKIGSVILDVAGRRDLLHTSLTAPFTVLRFIGNDLHPSDEPRAENWSQRLSQWQEAGIKKVFFFAHEPDDIKAPELAEIVIKHLNKNCDAKMSPMKWVDTTPAQRSLL